MIKVQSLLFILFCSSISLLHGQDVNQTLLENRWSAYDNFVIFDFFANGQVELEYAYCSHCKTNKDTLNWNLSNEILVVGEDSLVIKSATKNEIKTFQYKQAFLLKNVNKLKESKLKKTAISQFLITDTPLKSKLKSTKFDLNTKEESIQFNINGKMWIEDAKYKGQWALKSFYGDLFLIYLHRKAINRKFPLLKIISLKKGKFIGQPIPSIRQGAPFVLEISN